MKHDLKTWPAMFRAVALGYKTHEIRTNDRGFAVGDVLHLREWVPAVEGYTGNSYAVEVTYITPGGEWGISDSLCVMSIRRAS